MCETLALLLILLFATPLSIPPAARAAIPLTVPSLEHFFLRQVEPHLPRRGSRHYRPPTANEQAALRALVEGLLNAGDDWSDPALVERAAGLGFSLLRLDDRSAPDRRRFALVEQAVVTGRGAVKGWGMLVYTPDGSANHLVEVPYPLNNRVTGVVGIRLYEALDARWLLIAGSHRYANAAGGNRASVSDVGVQSRSPFHIFHRILAENRPAVQVRGWTRGRGAAWRRYPALVLTPGRDGAAGLAAVASRVDRNGAAAGLYSGAGLGASTLSGQGNLQGQFASGAPFAFLFFESDLRDRLLQNARASTLRALAAGLQKWGHPAVAGPPVVAAVSAPVSETATVAVSEIAWEPLTAGTSATSAPLASRRSTPTVGEDVALPTDIDHTMPPAIAAAGAAVALETVEGLLFWCGLLVVLLVAGGLAAGWLWLRSERLRRPVTKRLMRTERILIEMEATVITQADELLNITEDCGKEQRRVRRLEQEVLRERQMKEQFLNAYNKLVKTTNDLETRLREQMPRNQMTIPYLARLEEKPQEPGESRALRTAEDREESKRRAASRTRKVRGLLGESGFGDRLAGVLFAASSRLTETSENVARLAVPETDVRLRIAAIWALGELNAGAATSLLTDALEDGDSDIAQAAAEALMKQGHRPSRRVQATGRPGADRWFSPQVVFRRTPYKNRSEFLMLYLGDDDEDIRALALHTLASIGIRPHVGLFLEALQDHSPEVRFEATSLLGTLPIAADSPLLIDIDLRRRVTAALQRRQAEESFPHIRQATGRALARVNPA